MQPNGGTPIVGATIGFAATLTIAFIGPIVLAIAIWLLFRSWPQIRAGIERGLEDYATRGFTLSIGEWKTDVNAVGVPLIPADGSPIIGPAWIFVINAATLSVNAVASSKTYGDSDPSFSATLSGFRFSDTAGTSGSGTVASTSQSAPITSALPDRHAAAPASRP